MSLSIYNTLKRAVAPFSPTVPGKVSLYVCGMTVYDLCHLGHARVLVAFDVVQRWLTASGLEVTYVRNITDIDDKIIQRAVLKCMLMPMRLALNAQRLSPGPQTMCPRCCP
jgi:cysteinyl-tRNA synthetase